MFLLVFFVLSASAEAGVIRIMIQPISQVVNETGVFVVETQITNAGNEPAQNVRLSLVLPEELETQQFMVGTLQNGATVNVSFKVELDRELLTGVYPAVLVTDYTDINSYPFSSVTPGVIIYGEEAYPLLYAAMEKVEVEDKKTTKLPLNVRNLDDKAHNLKVRLYLPREVKTNNHEMEIFLEGQTEKTVYFEVTPFGALPKSSYLAFVSIEYEEDRHYTIYPSKPGIVYIGGKLSQTGGASAPDSEKSKLGEKGLVRMLPYILIIVSVVVIYFSFRGGD